MSDPQETFLLGVQPAFIAIVTAVHDAVCSAGRFDQAVKWKQLTYALENDFHHWVCAIGVTKQRVSLNFHFGGLLADSDGVLRAGSSKFLRRIDFTSVKDVDSEVIRRYVLEAIDRLDYFKVNWKQLQQS